MSETSKMGYSRLVAWEVWNFMSIEHGKCEFDERNIVNLKGYNDSGKSAMLYALRILLCNSEPTKHVSYIQDDKGFFRVMAYFDDGVIILRDKYINGQSLYELVKDGQVLYSTKSPSGALTKVSSVPEPIADYLGLVVYNNTCINCRSRHDKAVGVENTGSENYKMLNTVLKSEELATASNLLNSDKNKLINDINSLDNEITVQKRLLNGRDNITSDMIDWLKSADSNLDLLQSAESDLSHIMDLQSSISEIVVYDELQKVDNSNIVDLMHISSIIDCIGNIAEYPEVATVDSDNVKLLLSISDMYYSMKSINIAPELSGVDTDRLSDISNICGIVQKIERLSVSPELPVINGGRVDMLVSMESILSNIISCDNSIKDCDENIVKCKDEIDNLNKKLEELGVNLVVCPDCGYRFNPDETHVHS